MKKGLILYSDNMEDIEALGTRDLLLRAGFEIVSATFQDNLEVETAYGLKVMADEYVNDLDLEDFDFLVVPGGKYVSEVIEDDVNIKETINIFRHDKKLVSAICAAPGFLGELDMLDNIPYTAFPGTEKHAPKGKYMPDEKIIITDYIITARSAGAVFEFAAAITEHFYKEDAARKLLKNVIY